MDEGGRELGGEGGDLGGWYRKTRKALEAEAEVEGPEEEVEEDDEPEGELVGEFSVFVAEGVLGQEGAGEAAEEFGEVEGGSGYAAAGASGFVLVARLALQRYLGLRNDRSRDCFAARLRAW